MKKTHFNDECLDIFSSLRNPYLLTCCGKTCFGSTLDAPQIDTLGNSPNNHPKLPGNNSGTYPQRANEPVAVQSVKVRCKH